MCHLLLLGWPEREQLSVGSSCKNTFLFASFFRVGEGETVKSWRTMNHRNSDFILNNLLEKERSQGWSKAYFRSFLRLECKTQTNICPPSLDSSILSMQALRAPYTVKPLLFARLFLWAKPFGNYLYTDISCPSQKKLYKEQKKILNTAKFRSSYKC